MRQRRFLGALCVIALVAACAGPTAPAPTPTAVASASTSEVPSATAQTTTPSATANGWQLLTDFPINSAAQVNSIAALDKGFVAVGTATNQSAACPADTNHGRVWTSVDGIAWTSQADDAFAETDLNSVVDFNGAIFAIGFTGTLDTETPCPSPTQPAGVNVWRSSDGGVNWQQLPSSAVLARASVADVIVAGDKLLAVGSDVDSEDNQRGETWTSVDGQIWSPAELPPDAPDLASAAAKGSVVVGFGDDQDFPLPWISRDDAQHWYEESVDVNGADASQLSLSIEDVISTTSGYVAVGAGCCIGAAQLAPIVFTTPDGTQWKGTALAADHPQQMRRLGQVGHRLLAVGTQTYVNSSAGTADLGGRSWISGDDGKSWQSGPAFPELGDGNITALAIGPTGVVVAGVNFVDESVAGTDTGLRLWYAPISAFALGASN